MLEIIGKTYSIPKGRLVKVAEAAFTFLKLNDSRIELKFVTTAEITRLNTVYRGKNSPTDVLSFILDDKPLLGQVFICYNFSKAQAKKTGNQFFDEISLLLVHGILHVAGYDHTHDKEAKIMQKYETQILERIGI